MPLLKLWQLFAAVAVWLCAFGIVGTSTVALAARNSPETKGHPLANVVFDPAWTRVPRAFTGSDIRAVYSELFQRFSPREEFETSADYETRLALQKAAVLTYRFAFKPVHAENRYVADEGKLYVTVKGRQDSIGRYDWFTVVREVKQLPSFAAQNAFGATVRAKRIRESVYDAVLSNIVLFSEKAREKGQDIGYGGCEITLGIRCTSSEAKAIKDRLNVLFVVGLAEPYHGVDSWEGGPSLDMPVRIELSSRAVYTTVLEIWVYDSATGAVLLKVMQIGDSSENS